MSALVIKLVFPLSSRPKKIIFFIVFVVIGSKFISLYVNGLGIGFSNVENDSSSDPDAKALNVVREN
ncbi:MAG: hypothetical protein LBJ32_03465 [Oscillospiraceae bacterium]|nr:hypothetical protein [Oscillospiraceae bacterium]